MESINPVLVVTYVLVKALFLLKSVMSTGMMTTEYLGRRSGGAVSINTLLQMLP
jgi:hypothetical protein